MPQSNNSGTIRVLGIISLVISSIALLATLAVSIILFVGHDYFTEIITDEALYGTYDTFDNFDYFDDDWDLWDYPHHSDTHHSTYTGEFPLDSSLTFYGSGSSDYFMPYRALDVYGAMYSSVSFGLSIATLLFVIATIMNAIVVAASVICIANASKPEKRSSVFGWSIAGAIVGFLSANIISAILMIVSAVMSSKERQRTSFNPQQQSAIPSEPMPPVSPIPPTPPMSPTPQTPSAPVATPIDPTSPAAPMAPVAISDVAITPVATPTVASDAPATPTTHVATPDASDTPATPVATPMLTGTTENPAKPPEENMLP